MRDNSQICFTFPVTSSARWLTLKQYSSCGARLPVTGSKNQSGSSMSRRTDPRRCHLPPMISSAAAISSRRALQRHGHERVPGRQVVKGDVRCPVPGRRGASSREGSPRLRRELGRDLPRGPPSASYLVREPPFHFGRPTSWTGAGCATRGRPSSWVRHFRTLEVNPNRHTGVVVQPVPAVAAARVARVVVVSDSNEMGIGPPLRTASRNSWI